jgi:hypothetical protein
MQLQPTLLLDEPDLRPEMQALLQSSAHRTTGIISGRGIVDFYGPKIVCSHKLPQGTALATDALRIALIPVAGQQPPLDKRAETEIAEEFQSRLLGYFLRNSSGVQTEPVAGAVDPSAGDASNITGPAGHQDRHDFLWDTGYKSL